MRVLAWGGAMESICLFMCVKVAVSLFMDMDPNVQISLFPSDGIFSNHWKFFRVYDKIRSPKVDTITSIFWISCISNEFVDSSL